MGNNLVFAQGTTAAISGVVRDASGAVVPETAITVRQTETGLTRTAQTNADGGYFVPSLPVGPYELTAEKAGFKQQVRTGITLAVGQQAVVNWVLEVGQVQQTVEVTGEAPLVNTTLSSTSGLINEGQIKDMPLNGRSFEQLLTLNTGTVNNNSNSIGSSFSVAGKRTETNRFTINGVDYVGDNQTGQSIAPQGASQQLLGVDAVREYNVLGHTYGAEYGKRAGGQITVVTMSGTNQLHGAAFEYLRNNVLDARNFFSTTEGAPPFKRNQFGGSLGGPIRKDKMFVFGNYEGFRERLAKDNVAFVPSLGARQGLLPCHLAFPPPPNQAPNQPTPCQARGLDPAAYVPVPNLVTGMLPFLNNYWPAPNGLEILNANGLPTGTAYQNSNASRTVGENFGLARFDYNLSANDSVMSNFTVSKGERFESTGSTGQGANTNFLSNPHQQLYTLGAQETHIFSPTILNVAVFGFSHARGENQVIPRGPFPENLLLLKAGDQSNPGAFTFSGGANTNVLAPIIPVNGSNPHYNQRRYFTGTNDLRMTMGRHNLSLGVWVQRVHQGAFSSAQNNAGTASYSGLLAFLQDNLSQFVVGANPQLLNFGSTEAAWYFQDEIKLRPNLTVRLGLRDEMTTGWNSPDGKASNYLFDQNGVILTQPQIGRSPFVENNAVALWQPRVGVAWDPTGKGDWSVRAGFGIHNDLQDNLAHRLNSNPPFSARLTITGRGSDPVNGRSLLSFIPFTGGEAPPYCTSLDSQGRNAPAGCAIYAPGGLDPVLHTPTIQQWSLEIERAITPDLAVQVGYVGSESYHVSTSVDMNTIQPLRCENPAGCLAGGTLPATQRNVVPQGTEYVPVGTRPNRFVGSTLSWFYFGTSSYNALNVSLIKRSRGGLTFKTNYTWAKVLDLNSAILSNSADNDTATVLNRANPKLSRGVGSYSLLHQFNTNFSYQLPFGRGKAFGGGASGWAEKVIGGWQWNGIFNAQGGFPITPQVGANRSGDGNSRFADVPNRNPDFQGKVVLGVDEFKKTGHYFDPRAFLLPAAGTYGDSGRGTFRGPGLVNVDMSLFKRIPLNERWNLQFRAEAFNILNHANFDIPNVVVFDGVNYSGSAGILTETANHERQIQFALRLEF